MTGKAQQPMRFMLDAGAPVSVANAIRERGHIAILYNEVLAEGISDTVVCETALANDAILVAIDNDMNRIARSYGKPLKDDRFKALCFLGISCGEVQAANRIAQAFSLIELEWAFRCEKPAARRLWVEISNHMIRTNR